MSDANDTTVTLDDKVVYEQLCNDFRSLNGFLWQTPLIFMTLTGGLWFAVSSMELSATARSWLLVFAGIANLLMIAALFRLRFVMHKIMCRISESRRPARSQDELLHRHLLLAAPADRRDRLVRRERRSGPLFHQGGAEQPGPDTMSARALSHFEREASGLASRDDSISFEQVHGAIAPYLPALPAEILDVGAGSGRDARALAALGYDVVAVEPSASFRALAGRHDGGEGIQWVDDRLPRLRSLGSRAGQFDFILCSAVLMYVSSRKIGASFKTMATLLSDRGKLALSVRDRAGGESPALCISHHDADLVAAAKEAGLRLVERREKADALGRRDNLWRTFVFAKGALSPDEAAGK